MTSFLENPRRYPRAPARLVVSVAQRGSTWQAETEDLGPGGCLIVTPRELKLGSPLQLELGCSGVSEQLAVLGQVAWTQPAGQKRAGVVFAGKLKGRLSPSAWFQEMVRHQPELASRVSRAPRRLQVDALLYLLPPPEEQLELSPTEKELLERIISSGTSVRQLLESGTLAAPAAVRSIFGLFNKRALTLAPEEAVPAERWRIQLAGRAAPRRSAIPLAPPPAPPPLRRVAPPAPSPFRPAAPPLLERVARPNGQGSAAGRPAAPPDGAGRRGGRSPEAQECFDRARQAAEQGSLHTAVGLLRRALQLAPRDAEVAKLLGDLSARTR